MWSERHWQFFFCFILALNQLLLRSCYSSSGSNKSHHDSPYIRIYTWGPTGNCLETCHTLISGKEGAQSETWFLSSVSQLSMEVQFSLVHHILAMVKSERNRQVLCEGGLVSTLLTHCRNVLLAPNHPLHLPVTRILEKLSSQAISHVDLR